MLPPLITIAAAAFLLTLHPRTVKRLIHGKQIAAHRIGEGQRGRYIVVSESVGEFLSRNIAGPSDVDDDPDLDDYLDDDGDVWAPPAT